MVAAISYQLQNLSSYDSARLAKNFHPLKDALVEDIHSLTTKYFSGKQDEIENALSNINTFEERITILKKSQNTATKLHSLGYLNLEYNAVPQKKDPQDSLNLETKRPSNILYKALSRATPENLNKSLDYLRMPLNAMLQDCNGRAIRMPRSTLIFFKEGILGRFPELESTAKCSGSFATIFKTRLGKTDFVYKTPGKNPEITLKIESYWLMLLKNPRILAIEAIDKNGLYLPSADGDLRGKDDLSQEDQLHFSIDIAQALTYIHSLGITHKDVKSENILRSKSYALLCDFGLACHSEGDHNKIGTLECLAPELHRADPPYSEKVDVWAFGIFLYEIVINRHPFYRDSTQIRDWKGGKFQSTPFSNKINSLGPMQKMMITIAQSCLHSDPKERPSMQEILDKLKSLSKLRM